MPRGKPHEVHINTQYIQKSLLRIPQSFARVEVVMKAWVPYSEYFISMFHAPGHQGHIFIRNRKEPSYTHACAVF